MSNVGRELKVIILGDMGVGRTSTLLRYENLFRFECPLSSVFELKKKFRYRIFEDNSLIEVVFWDMIEPMFGLLESSFQRFYSDSNGVLLMFDLTKINTLRSLLKWYTDFRKTMVKNVEGFVIGNKLDLERQVSEEEGRNLAEKLGFQYSEISAKTNLNVVETFNSFLSNLFNTEKFERIFP